MKVHFLLKKPTSTDATLIYASFQYKGKRIRISTSDFILPAEWLGGRARKISGRSDLAELNRKLDGIESTIKELYYRGGTATELKDRIVQRLKSKPTDTLYTYMDKIIANHKLTGKCHKSMQSTRTLLEAFSQHLTFEDIDAGFYRDFIAWMHRRGYTYKKEHHKYSKNYVGKLIGNIKMALNRASEDGLTINTHYKLGRRTSEKVYNVYNTMEELIRIYHTDLAGLPGIERARDLYLVSAFTGLRFSDYKKLTPANFSGEEYITQDMSKVSARVVVPLHWIVKEILAKYAWRLPAAPSNVRMNEHIKTFGRMAGIDGGVIKTRTEGGRRVQHHYKKWELMTTHTARRSMATNMYLAGIPLLTISMLLGHSHIKQTMDYIKVSEVELSLSLASHPFFQK